MNGDAVSASALREQRLHFLFPEKRLKNRKRCRRARPQRGSEDINPWRSSPPQKPPSSTMTAATLPLTGLLCLLLVCHLNGQQPRGSKCLCEKKGANHVKEKVKSFEVFPADHSCHRVEILVTTASGKQCLDPASPNGRRLLTKWNKKNRKTAPPTVM
ncbi:unnamed protein product [Gadus morhua 'NCC']